MKGASRRVRLEATQDGASTSLVFAKKQVTHAMDHPVRVKPFSAL
jgi:hypothetical protein